MEQTFTLTLNEKDLNLLNSILITSKSVEFGVMLGLFQKLQAQLQEQHERQQLTSDAIGPNTTL